MLDAFCTNGSSPPARRYRLKLATWTIVREPGQPSPRKLDGPTAVSGLAIDLTRGADDGREHFWAVLLNAQLGYLMHTEVSVGTLNGSLVHPREVFGPAVREDAASMVLIHNHPSAAARGCGQAARPPRSRPPHRRRRKGAWVSFAARGLL